jgi:hypothetical protein
MQKTMAVRSSAGSVSLSQSHDNWVFRPHARSEADHTYNSLRVIIQCGLRRRRRPMPFRRRVSMAGPSGTTDTELPCTPREQQQAEIA